jgi:hypothetical protein
MAHVNLSSPGGTSPHRPASPAPRPAPEASASAAAAPPSPSPRDTAGATAPAVLASPETVPHFEKRTAPAPEIPGVRAMIDLANADGRPPHAVLADLRQARAHFAGIRARGEQTNANRIFNSDGKRTQKLITSILNAENARTPGLNAVGFASKEKMVEFLQVFSSPIRDGQEGHIRCHVGFGQDTHRVAVDAFKHREGGFTLVAVDSGRPSGMMEYLHTLERNHADLIKGILYIPTPNQLHLEGCRIFAVHNLNALHDYQPHIQDLHRQIYDRGRGRPASRLEGPEWKYERGNTLELDFVLEAFLVLPPKFFKHMQLMKPKPGENFSQMSLAEELNPALRTEPVNKKGQTLRERLASQNPGKPLDQFSRADRTATLDNKRLVLIDRAIAHYENRYGSDGNALPPGRRFWIGNGWY